MPPPALWEQAVTYGAVGGTKAEDLLSFPPEGFRPFERRSRIGHGQARWEHAWPEVLSWGIQRGAGMTVRRSEAPRQATGGGDAPLAFDAVGAPLTPADGSERVHDASGNALLMPGDTVTLLIPFLFLRVTASCRVIYVVDEPRRKGFAYGTLPGHPESGEEAFLVEQTEDGSVWLTIRAFSRPADWRWWAVYPVLRLAQAVFTRRYFRSLGVPIG